MRQRGRWYSAAACCALMAGVLWAAPDAHGALISAAGRKARLSASVKIKTNSSGQRQILITIDPGVTTAFNIDVAYPEQFVTPDFQPADPGAGGTLGAMTPVTYLPPYGPTGGMGAPLLHAGVRNAISLVSNIQGRYPLAGGARPLPNRPDGGSDLFTLTFNDNAPDRPRVFTVLGAAADGSVDPELAPYIADNYLDALVTDPSDPFEGQFLHFAGDQIEMLEIVVPADVRGAGTVPLPAGVFGGAIVGVAILVDHVNGRRRYRLAD